MINFWLRFGSTFRNNTWSVEKLIYKFWILAWYIYYSHCCFFLKTENWEQTVSQKWSPFFHQFITWYCSKQWIIAQQFQITFFFLLRSCICMHSNHTKFFKFEKTLRSWSRAQNDHFSAHFHLPVRPRYINSILLQIRSLDPETFYLFVAGVLVSLLM